MTGMTYDDIVIPALLRAARGAYSNSIRASLATAGFDDMPRHGPWVLGGMTNRGGTAPELLRDLRVGRPAAAQLVDTLVLRGYLERRADGDGPVEIELTARGRAAGDAVRTGVEAVDARLAERITPSEMAGLRAGLGALADMVEEARAEAE
jgi:DNA-binding MarR family transcriptional regulator